MATKKEDMVAVATEDISKFSQLYHLDVSKKTEQKNGLTYLSWTWAWAEFKKAYPDATYRVVKHPETHLPCFPSREGVMCYTEVTAGGITYEMWLPVMDSANHAMKPEPYEITTKYGKTIPVAAYDMFDVNKTVMRCLVKNLAMFGLGLYVFAGEDYPEEDEETLKLKAEARVKTAVDEMGKASSRDEMNKVWNKYPDLQANQDFVAKTREVAAKYPKEQAA